MTTMASDPFIGLPNPAGGEYQPDPAPWTGYDTDSTDEVIASLAGMHELEPVLTVASYEECHQARVDVLRAAVRKAAELIGSAAS